MGAGDHGETVRMQALHEVAVAAGRGGPERELADLVVERARVIAGGEAAVLRWFEPAQRGFRLVASAGLEGALPGEIAAGINTAIAGAFSERKPVVDNQYETSGLATEWGRSRGVKGQVAVPLLVEGIPVGTLAVLSLSGRKFDERDALFLSLLAAIVAPALEAARLSKEVRQHEATVMQVYEALPVAIVVYDSKGRPIHDNSAAEAMIGVRALEGVRARNLPMFHEDGTPVAFEERPSTLALERGAAVRGQILGFDDEQGRRWAHIDAVPLLDADGKVEAVVTSSIDVTSLKAAEERLRESEQLFSGAFQASGVGMALTELDGTVLRVNPTLCEILGYGESDLIRLDARTLVEPDDLAATRQALADLFRHGSPSVATTTARLVHKSGQRLWGQVTVSIIRNEAGPFRALVHVLDVTDERRADQIMRSEQARLTEIIEAQGDIAGSEFDFARLLAVLSERTVRLTGRGGVAVMLPQGDDLVVRALAGPSEVGPGFTLPIATSVAGLSYSTGHVQRVADAVDDPRVHRETARRLKIRSIVSVPIMSGGQVMGVLQLMSPEPDAFDETDIRTVQMVAGFAGAAFERASAATRLRSSERRTRAVIESAPYPIVIFDTQTALIVDFNPAAEAAFGRSKKEALGAPATSLLPARHVEGFQRWIENGAQAGSAEYAGRKFETSAIRADGTEFPIEAAIADLPEETRLAAAFMRDLTLRFRLQESMDRLTAVISQTPVILFACDPDGVVTLSEGRGLSTLGLQAEDIVGHRLQELLANQPAAMWHLERALRGESYSGQIHLNPSGDDEGDAFLEGTYGPIRDEAGNFLGVSAILTNVTDRVRAEAAQRESEAKSRLMSVMNHEVRTPLNSILGFTHLLKQPRFGQLNEVQRRYVSHVEEAGKQLLDLINDSLDLARLKSGHPAIKLATLAIGDVVLRVADQAKPGALDRELELAVAPMKGLAVTADERLLTQVLLNLLSNAIRHTPPGGSVTVSAHPAGPEVALVVADTGVGIPKPDLEHIFEEFFQASNHAAGGTGLGLTITRRLVQLMGGSIAVESELGAGSTFTVTLPAASL